MKILKFKTNIDNDESIDNIASSLDKSDFISKWNVDTDHEDNILSVSGEEITPSEVIKILEEKGFKAETIHVQAIGGHDL